MKLPAVALIVRAPYAMNIVEGLKWLEMRSSATAKRERIGIIEAGTGLIIGETTIFDCFKFEDGDAEKFQRFHKVEDLSLLEKWCFAWAVTNARKYKKPVKYNHPQGAVIWVDLTKKGVLK